eukprot:4291494-Amphidinium_carterae.3
MLCENAGNKTDQQGVDNCHLAKAQGVEARQAHCSQEKPLSHKLSFVATFCLHSVRCNANGCRLEQRAGTDGFVGFVSHRFGNYYPPHNGLLQCGLTALPAFELVSLLKQKVHQQGNGSSASGPG